MTDAIPSRNITGAGFSILVRQREPEPNMLLRDFYEIAVDRPLIGEEAFRLMHALKCMLLADDSLTASTVLR